VENRLKAGERQAKISLALMVAACLIGVYSQVVLPARAGAEMWSLARSIADHGTFANPFMVLATGPTAVNPPGYPFILAGFIKVFRMMSHAYYAAVLGCILVNAATAALLPRVALVFFGDAIPGIAASILWLATMQTIPGWDTNYTVLGLIVFCLVTAPVLRMDGYAGWRACLGGIVAGCLFLMNPSTVLVTFPWIGYLLWRTRARLRSACIYCGIIVFMMSLFVLGWSSRNYIQLGGFVTRTNLGFTLYASNNDCAQSSLIKEELSGCYGASHPNENLGEAELLHKIGEIQYDHLRVADTKAWMKANPDSFLRLTGARALEFWFPAREVIPAGEGGFISIFNIPNYAQRWAAQQNRIAYIMWLVTGLSWPGLVLMVRGREPVTLYVLAVSVVYPLMYYIVVSDMRYRYPVLWLSLLPAGYLLRDVLMKIGRASGKISADAWKRISATLNPLQ
jgi:hypothetical protein